MTTEQLIAALQECVKNNPDYADKEVFICDLYRFERSASISIDDTLECLEINVNYNQ